MKLFDSHAHYEDKMFENDAFEVLDSLKDTNVAKVLNCCSDVEVFDRVMDIAHKYDFMYCSIGVHPHWVMETPDDYLARIEELAADPKVVAIGEMGLDYFFDEPKDVQERIFRQQLELAQKLDKPVIIHDRESHEDCFRILREYKPQGIIHRYSGPYYLLKEALDWGMYVSINNDLTYPGWIDEYGQWIREVDLDHLLIETDCPYAPPHGSGKERCTSADVVDVLKCVAALKGVSEEELADITYRNTLKAYRISEE